MPASLLIQVTSVTVPDIQEIKFFDTEDWNAGSEKELLSRLQDMLAVIRSVSISCEIKINLEVSDLPEALFLIKKKAAGHFEVNDQKLTLREIEVFGLIMQGLTNNEIAAKLFISYETVKSHRKKILEKSGAKNTAALITYYHQTFSDK